MRVHLEARAAILAPGLMEERAMAHGHAAVGAGYRLVWIAVVLTAGAAVAQPVDEAFKLTAGDGAAYDEFGYSVAMGDGLVAVAAPRDDDRGPNSGSVYLFDAYTGDQLAKLMASDGAIEDWFGISVSIGDGYLAVGCPLDDAPFWSGAVYLFDTNSELETAKMYPADGDEWDYFGSAVAVGGGFVVVGAYRDDDNGNDAGAAYVFDASTGAPVAKLLAADGAPDDWVGSSVAIDGGKVVVGARLDGDQGNKFGSAYLFDAATGVQLGKFVPSDSSNFDECGVSVAIENGRVAAGAYHDSDRGEWSGSA